MSEVGGHESFLWETQSWTFLNSDNSGATDEKSGGRPPDSGPNTQTPTGKEAAGAAGGKKRSGGSNKGGGSGEVSEGKGGGGGGSGGGGESDHEIHIWTERERRKKMRNMFSNLHALLPQLPPKADKSTIVDEAVNYIKTVQQSLQKLQRKKLERLRNVTTSTNFDPSMPQKLGVDTREAFVADQVSSNSNSNSSGLVSRFPLVFQSWTSQNVVLNVCGDQAQINVCAPKKPGLFTAICYVMERHKLDVVSAHVSSDQNRTMFMIQAHARIAPDQLQEAFPVEEIFKQAAGEIMLWISNLETF